MNWMNHKTWRDYNIGTSPSSPSAMNNSIPIDRHVKVFVNLLTPIPRPLHHLQRPLLRTPADPPAKVTMDQPISTLPSQPPPGGRPAAVLARLPL